MLLLGSFYLPNRCDEKISDFNKLIREVTDTSYDKVILMGDANAWHPSWSPHSEKRGTLLAHNLHKHNLHVLPIAGPNRVGHDGQKDTYIDLFITNDENIRTLTPHLDYEFDITTTEGS